MHDLVQRLLELAAFTAAHPPQEQASPPYLVSAAIRVWISGDQRFSRQPTTSVMRFLRVVYDPAVNLPYQRNGILDRWFDQIMNHLAVDWDSSPDGNSGKLWVGPHITYKFLVCDSSSVHQEAQLHGRNVGIAGNSPQSSWRPRPEASR